MGSEMCIRDSTGTHVNPEDACGLTVAVQRTTVSETDDVRPKNDACIEAGKPPITILSFDTSDNAALAALVGRADAFSADSPVTSWAVERSDGKLELVGDMFDAAPYGIAVPKDSGSEHCACPRNAAPHRHWRLRAHFGAVERTNWPARYRAY